MVLEITQYKPADADFARVGDRLSAFTLKQGAPAYDPVTVAFRAAIDGTPAGELIGTMLWGRLEVNLLEVPEDERGKGIGTELMRLAEEFARAHDAVGIDLWTPTWQGEGFYETLGYEVAARLPLNTKGHFDGAPKYKIIYHKEL